MTSRLDPQTVESVIAHMNDDHADACLFIVMAFSPHTVAVQGRLIDLDDACMTFRIHHPLPTDQSQPASLIITVDFPEPLRDESKIRKVLVDMTRKARDIIASPLDPG